MDNILQTLSLTNKEATGILIMTVTFFVYWRLFNALVFSKFVTLFEAREKVTVGAHDASDQLVATANELEKEVQISLDNQRAKLSAERTLKLEEAKNAANTTIKSAEEFSSKLIHETREKLEFDYKESKRNMSFDSEKLAKDLSDKIKSASIYGFATLFLFTDLAHAGSGHGAATIEGLIPYAVNFTLYVSILFYFLRKPIKQAWANRIVQIRNQVQSGQAERVAAENRLNQAKDNLANLNSQIDTLKEDFTASLKLEASTILKDAHDRALRIREQGQSMAIAETNSMKKKFKSELALAVIEKAKETLKKETSNDVDKVSRQKTLNNLNAVLN
jgi:F-type H+-transporting ATPase subunit b